MPVWFLPLINYNLNKAMRILFIIILLLLTRSYMTHRILWLIKVSYNLLHFAQKKIWKQAQQQGWFLGIYSFVLYHLWWINSLLNNWTFSYGSSINLFWPSASLYFLFTLTLLKICVSELGHIMVNVCISSLWPNPISPCKLFAPKLPPVLIE